MVHPLHQFKFCPVCGKESFLARNEKAKACALCGFVYYFNPSAAVAAFVTNPKGELLLVKRGKDPAKGTLDLPGGFLDMDENAEQAITREIREETGLEITQTEYLFSLPNIYPYMGFDVHTLDIFYKCQVDSFDGATPADDAAEIVILPPEQINPELFGLISIKAAVKLFINNEN